MSIDIIAQRGAGNIQAPDITDPLISPVEVARVRARNFFDSESANLKPIRLAVTYRVGVLVGQLVEVTDTFQGTVFYGQVVSVRHRYNGAESETSLSIVRV